MLSSEEQMHIIKSAIAEGYKGEIFKLIDQASIEKGAVAQTQEQQEQGLRGSDGNTAMAFPNSDENFNTQGMDFELDMRKYDKEGNLVKSYQKVPPGIKSLNMGEEEGTVIETPSQYQKGGFNFDKKTDYSPEAIKERQKNNKINWDGIETVLSFGPGSGEVIDAKNTIQDLSSGDYVGAAANAAGFALPFVSGKMIKQGVNTLRKNWHNNPNPNSVLETNKTADKVISQGKKDIEGMVTNNPNKIPVSDITGSNIKPLGDVGELGPYKGKSGRHLVEVDIGDGTKVPMYRSSSMAGKTLTDPKSGEKISSQGFYSPYLGSMDGTIGRKFIPGWQVKTTGWDKGYNSKYLENLGHKLKSIDIAETADEINKIQKIDGPVINPIIHNKKGGYRRKQYQDAGFIGPQLPPGYVAPKKEIKVEPDPEPVVQEKKKVVKTKPRNKTRKTNKTYSTDRPRNSKDIKKMQELLISEGFNVGETGADGSWGDNTQKAYDKYKSRTDSKEISWMDRLRGINSKISNKGVSQSVQTYGQYVGNALLQGYGLVGEDESYFDVTEKDLRPDELATYKSMLRDNLNKGRGSTIDYRGYSNDPKIANASSSEEARQLLEGRGITNTLLNDFNPLSGTNATKEALHTLTGNANYTIDKKGNVYVQDNYDFNYSQNKKGLKTGTTFSELYGHATADKYDGRGYDNAHSVGDQVKSRIPVSINLGSATDLGLTPNEIAQLGEYNPNASNVKTVSTLELLKRGSKKIFGFQQGGMREKPKGMQESNYVFKYPSKREQLKTEINKVVNLEKESNRPKTKKLLEVSNYMENSMGNNPEAYNRTYTNSQASIDEIMLNDLFDKKKDEDGNPTKHSATQKRYFTMLKNAGLPTNKKEFKKELQSDNPAAAVNAMRMVYGKVPEAIPEVTDTLGMFNYYNDHYRKNNKIKDLTESKKRFYEGYRTTFKKGGLMKRKCKYGCW